MYDLNHYFITKKYTRDKLIRFLRAHRTDGYTLDIGCGNQAYKTLFPNSICADIDPDRHPDVVADLHNLKQFASNSFDCVLCTEVLEHCYDPQKASEEMFRVLKPGGILLLSTRFIFPMHDTPHDYYRFTKYGLQHLFQDFKIIELKEEANSMETMGILYQRLAFQSVTRTVLSRLFWFLRAERCTKKREPLRQYGNLLHTGESEIILTSGYYLALQKPEDNKEVTLL